jgi:hypothetical protein
MMKYQDLDYTISNDQIYLVVRGNHLKTTGGASYLWWLNGSNHGTQVAPTKVTSLDISEEEQTIVAWDMTRSGLYENFSGDRPSVCLGQTIFGLTSTTGQSDIYDINFVSNVDEYVSSTTGVNLHQIQNVPKASTTYNLGGSRTGGHHGVVVTKGRKYIKK